MKTKLTENQTEIAHFIAWLIPLAGMAWNAHRHDPYMLLLWAVVYLRARRCGCK